VTKPDLPPGIADFIAEHRRAYVRSGGTEGHILDGRGSGGHRFATQLLLRYRGRKSGRTMVTPLSYGSFRGEVVVIASKGGADSHPAWYLNLIAAPEVDFQIATQAFRASWREPEGEERERVWDFMVGNYPFYAAYRERTERRIPVVMLKVIEPIAVFTQSDIG
jgi:deazaflavin-dependent oxidoreductase (nitroreductase family)